MTENKPVLLLPGPASVAAASHYFGSGYEYVSYLTSDYLDDGAGYVTNSKLKALASRDVLLWQTPPRGRSGNLALRDGPISIIRYLLKLECRIQVVALTETDEQYEPGVCLKIDMSKEELMAWARAHKRAVDLPPETEEVPRETMPAKRGKPRTKANGQPPKGVQIDAGTSAFVSWEQLGLECSSNGAPHPHLANVQRILAFHPNVAGRIWFDEFHGKVFQTLFQPDPAEWADSHDIRMTVWIQNNLRLSKVGHQIVRHAVDDYAQQNVRNEVREWMDGLAWDGHERLPKLMANAFGTPQNDYTAAVGRCWIVSMAARTYDPGCQVHTMPVFEGGEGVNKSTALRVIGGKWFAEMHEDITSKDFLQNLPGKLLIEISELHAFRRAEVQRIKGIISCATDRYRASYGRRAADHPRRGVWSGTTNRDDWNESDTGARRFWPISCGKIDLEYLTKWREQLFAEAVHRFKAGESWWDIDAALAKVETEKRREADEWTDSVMAYASKLPSVTVGEILNTVICIPLRDVGKTEQMRVASILRVAGFVRETVWHEGRVQKKWLNPAHLSTGCPQG